MITDQSLHTDMRLCRSVIAMESDWEKFSGEHAVPGQFRKCRVPTRVSVTLCGQDF